jgi:hypothetical protein
MRITDTLEEQAILESLIEEVKPLVPPECRGLHYLLYTPFRYAPYPHGSRFRRARQREGAFYASERVETAIAETAFYRLLFYLEAPAARLPARPTEHTAFRAAAATERLIDLTAPPLDRDAAIWRHPVDYRPCHDLADAARGPDGGDSLCLGARPGAAGERSAALPQGVRSERARGDRNLAHLSAPGCGAGVARVSRRLATRVRPRRLRQRSAHCRLKPDLAIRAAPEAASDRLAVRTINAISSHHD